MKILAGRELRRVSLEVADTAVVEAGIARDVVERAFLAHASRALADDHGELALVVELLGLARFLQRLLMADDAAAEAYEQHGTFRALAAHLFDVRQVVDADAEQLGRSVGNRGRERHVAKTKVRLHERKAL